MATYRAGFVLASVLHILGFSAIVCVRLGAALQRQHGKRRQIRPFTNIPTDAAQLTKTPACSAEYLYPRGLCMYDFHICPHYTECSAPAVASWDIITQPAK